LKHRRQIFEDQVRLVLLPLVRDDTSGGRHDGLHR